LIDEISTVIGKVGDGKRGDRGRRESIGGRTRLPVIPKLLFELPVTAADGVSATSELLSRFPHVLPDWPLVGDESLEGAMILGEEETVRGTMIQGKMGGS
jgi:hypothetical protein